MERQGQAPAEPNRHAPVTYALLEQPRPGNREIRRREALGAWLERSDRAEDEHE